MGVKIESSPRIQFRNYALTIEGDTVEAVEAAARTMKQGIVARSPSRLRGVGTHGARLSVRYDVKGRSNPTAVVRAVGPWQLIEDNTRPHTILSKKLGGRQRRSRLASGLFVRAPGQRLLAGRGGVRGAVLTPQGPRAYARHPGTRGQHPWARGVERATPAATLAFARTMKSGLAKAFR